MSWASVSSRLEQVDLTNSHEHTCQTVRHLRCFGPGGTRLSQPRRTGAGGTASPRAGADRAAGPEPGSGRRGGRVQRQTVNIRLRRYRALGEDGVLDGRRVSPRRGKGLLTADEAGQGQGWIRDRTPDQLKLPFALWTSRAVRDLITLRFQKTLGLSTVQLYLRRWGLTPQKPLARAKERQPAAIAAWLERHYPAIAKRAKAQGAVIYWG